MFNSRFIQALIKKEFLQIFRDPSSILIAIVLPLLLLFIYGYGLNLDSNTVKVGVVIEAPTKESLDLASSFSYSKFFKVDFFKNRKEISEQMLSGKLRGFIVIPADFSKDLALNQAQIQVIADGSEPNIASFVSGYSQGVLKNWQSQQRVEEGVDQAPIINAIQRFWYNPELKSKNFLIPGSLAIIMTLIGTLLTALVIAREWERGTMEALIATPVSKLDILISKIVPYYFLGISSMLICFWVTRYVFHVPFRGSIFLLFVVTSLFLFAALCQGLLISILAKDQFIASQMALTSAFLPAFMLSGFIFEISSMPVPIQFLTHLFPARYFVTCLQSFFLVGDVNWLIFKNCCFLILLGLFFFFLMLKKFKKEVV